MKPLNLSLSKIILNGSDEDLKKTEITQPAILITSYAIFSVLKKEFNFDFSKLNTSQVTLWESIVLWLRLNQLSLEDGLKLVHERGKLMQAAVPEGKGAMLAVMGLDIEEVNSKIKKFE